MLMKPMKNILKSHHNELIGWRLISLKTFYPLPFLLNVRDEWESPIAWEESARKLIREPELCEFFRVGHFVWDDFQLFWWRLEKNGNLAGCIYKWNLDDVVMWGSVAYFTEKMLHNHLWIIEKIVRYNLSNKGMH